MLDEGFMAESGAKTIQQEREEVHAALQHAASFHCLVEEWKECEELKPQPKGKWMFVDQQVPMYEMWKRQQVHEDARKSTGPKYLSKNLGKW